MHSLISQCNSTRNNNPLRSTLRGNPASMAVEYVSASGNFGAEEVAEIENGKHVNTRLCFLFLSFQKAMALSFIGHVHSLLGFCQNLLTSTLKETNISHFSFRCSLPRYSGRHRPRSFHYPAF